MDPKALYLTVVTLAVFGLWQLTAADTFIDQTEAFLKKFGAPIDRLMKEAANEQNQAAEGEIYATEHLEDMREKRDATSQPAFIRKERAIHREGSPLKIHLVSFHHADGSRYKRATYNTTTETWPNLIPYKFDITYPPELIPKVTRIMADVMDHVCIKWVREPDFDPNNNDYPTNAYLKFVGDSGNICGTFLGQGDGHGSRKIRTCTQYYSIVHELLHTLGVIHEQQGPLSLNHLTLALDNILDGYWGGTYKLHNNPSRIQTNEFDGSSIMMYSRRSFSKNGLDILLPFRDEEFDINYNRHTSMDNAYMELNGVYKCNALYCNNAHVDCGLGYHTRVKGVCQCVCPEGFDPAHGCRQLDDETSGPQTWPDVPFTLYAADVNSCPTGLSPARFEITGTRNPIMIGDPFFSMYKTTYYFMCTRDASSSNSDMNFMPLGTYCVVKPVGIACNGAFQMGHFNVTSTQAFGHTGNYGDWPYSDNEVDMNFCCRDDRDWFYPMELPRQSAFRLISKDGQCTTVKGMRFELGRIAMFNKNGERHGIFPNSWLSSYYLIHSFCTYTPAIYGCNQNITLDAANSFIEIKTPGFDSGSRENNRRCLYNFNIPEGSRVKVTFNTFDIETNDLFNVRRFNKWARPLYEFDNYFVKQFISEKEFLFLEYWSGRTYSYRHGIHLTAELLTGSCFEESGRSYKGEKAVSELFEPCLPWTDAVDCEDFPYVGAEAVDLMFASNHCRNPGGRMERPWCYVSVDRGLCKRAYCDVCNDLNDDDRLTNCASLQANDPDFCTSGLQRFKCAQTCGLNLNVAPPTVTGTCSTPPVPSDGTPLVPLQASYNVGDIVSFDCNVRVTNEDPTEIECTENGWPNLQSACTECPLGWIPYGNRCFFYMPHLQFVDDAKDACALKGGRLFVFRNPSDVEVIRNFKQTSTISTAYGGSWVNIALVGGQWVVYDDHSVPAPYLDWASDAVLNDESEHGCAVMNWEYDTTGNVGKFSPCDCNLALSRAFCEIPRSTLPVCADKSTGCANALTNDAGFCLRDASFQVASLYCEKSCANCVDDNMVTCDEPTSAIYHRTSPDNVVDAGEVMTFGCSPGLYHISGDLKRACGLDGNFLGDEPMCGSIPNPVDIGMSGVMRRGKSSPSNLIHLLDIDGFRIPYNGVVSHWHFYGTKAGDIHFVVYRYNIVTGLYTIVGGNTVSITTLSQRWSHVVPSGDRILVQEGDVYGFFTIEGEIAATSCNGYPEQPMTLITESSNDLGGLYGDKTFGTSSCLIPSLGLRVVP